MFKSGQLVPTVVQEIDTNEVLMLAYSNIDSLMRTIQSGYAHYYSRSRAKLWKKGETSGNVQTIISIASDCDNDTILFKVLQKGVACHTGSHNCFFNQLYINQ
ncbi:MAG: phosphoribosyl-AMP cyclohydrolase [Christensenellaceae bacterium]|nr:phosphoribosyl-AMP cyclohydrolase [Christensenellaceae bacterium]